MHFAVPDAVGAWFVMLLNNAVDRPLSSWIATVPAAKLFPLLVVVAVKAAYVPRAATLPRTPTVSRVRRIFRFVPIPILSRALRREPPRRVIRIHPCAVCRLPRDGRGIPRSDDFQK
jgi:hypothetical protein